MSEAKLFQIPHRFSGSILFELKTTSFKLCAELAVSSDANLRDATLSGANLSGANLSGATLSGADLSGANLSDATLSGSDLSGAYLSGAYLSGAYLSGAYLSDANLSDATLSGANLRDAYLRGANLSDATLSGSDLSGANLSGANLRDAYLNGANLSGAYLRGATLSDAYLNGANLSDAYLNGAKGINPYLCTPLMMLYDQPGPIRAYKIVNFDNEGIYQGGLVYEINAELSVDDANTDASKFCGAGINVATLDWCMREWEPERKILIVEHTAKDIACIPIATDGKYRLHRCKVVGEKDLKEIGLIEEKDAA